MSSNLQGNRWGRVRRILSFFLFNFLLGTNGGLPSRKANYTWPITGVAQLRREGQKRRACLGGKWHDMRAYMDIPVCFCGPCLYYYLKSCLYEVNLGSPARFNDRCVCLCVRRHLPFRGALGAFKISSTAAEFSIKFHYSFVGTTTTRTNKICNPFFEWGGGGKSGMRLKGIK